MRLKSETPFAIQIDRSRNATGTAWQLSPRIRALSNFDSCESSMRFDVQSKVCRRTSMLRCRGSGLLPYPGRCEEWTACGSGVQSR
jgi:hypothetical protein